MTLRYWGKIVKAYNYSDLKWPAPDWYHVPTAAERQWLYNILEWLTWNGTGIWNQYLHVPLAGALYLNGQLYYDGSYFYLWSSTGNNTYQYDATWVSANMWTSASLNDRLYKERWYNIRCFKNEFVVPTSNWTVSYWTLWSGWIFWNQAVWIISITADWTTWYTIQDKNLWATTVYNQSDTRTAANCWNYYQRWNNYWFARTWATNYSTTAVNASSYWPWNYYSSDTFIEAWWDWSSPSNNNLRWWTTWEYDTPAEIKERYYGTGTTLKKVLKVYYWSTMVRPKIPDYLCFTADAANAGIQLTKSWNPTSVNFETSTDWVIWSDYSIWTQITLSAIWDKIYFRNKSETVTNFSTNASNYYRFILSWDIKASWDCNYLLCKYSTRTLPNTYCFAMLFYQNWTYLKTPPKLPAENAPNYCYYRMFRQCNGMVWIPKLPATTIWQYSYREMFYYCSWIKLSSSQTWDYQQPYRIPTEWTWTWWTNWNYNMLSNTWWAYQSNPAINTTYYVHTDDIIV